MTKESFRKQLNQVKKQIGRRLPHSPADWMRDGTDHINIHTFAETELGRILSLDYRHDFRNPKLGHFVSINSAWFYLRANKRQEVMRKMWGKTLKNFVKQTGGAETLIPHFQAVILDIAYRRIMSSRKWVEMMATSVLPFDSYMVRESGVCERFGHTFWFCQGMEEIRTAIKEEREPDFSFAMSKEPKDKDIELYDGAVAALKTAYSEEEIAAAEELRIKLEKEAKAAYAARQAEKKRLAREQQDSGLEKENAPPPKADMVMDPGMDAVTPVPDGAPEAESLNLHGGVVMEMVVASAEPSDDEVAEAVAEIESSPAPETQADSCGEAVVADAADAAQESQPTDTSENDTVHVPA